MAKRKKKNKGIIIVPVFILLVAAIAFSAYVFHNTSSFDNKIYTNVYINDINVGGLTKQEAMKLLDEKLNQSIKDKKIVLKYSDKKFHTDYDQLKVHYDFQGAVNEAFNIGKKGNLVKKTLYLSGLKSNPQKITVKLQADESKISKIVKRVARNINKDPVDATVKLNGAAFSVVDGQNGISVDQKKLKSDILASINSNLSDAEIDITVNSVEPKVKKDALSSINTKISSFTTMFKLSDANRSGNIKIASQAVDGTVVMPGEVFSMNKAVGPRIGERGFKEANVIINGELVPGMAGGICQVTTTVYNAALYANFPIVSRRAHALRVHYVPAGRDATISGDAIDFKFRNSNKTPIFVHTYVSGGSVTADIYGTNEHPEQKVVVSSEVTQTLDPPSPTLIKDSSLKEGEKVVETKSVSGSKSITYRKVYNGDTLVKTEVLSKDTYKPMRGVIKIGSKKANSSVASPSEETVPTVN